MIFFALNGARMLLAIVVVALFTLPPAWAETQEEKGLAIAVEGDRRDAAFESVTAQMRMELKNRHGEESVRDIQVRTFEMPADGDKSLVVFDSPPDVKGTVLLTHSHRTGDDDQWLYLPALKRVKRISGRNKSGSFMGSEFSYEDIASQEVEKYTYRWLRDESFKGHDCFVSERYPVDLANSGYSRQVVWVDQHEYYPVRVEYYDRKASLLKTLSFDGYEKYENRFWRPARMEMVNHQNGKSTVLDWSEYRFRAGLVERDFDSSGLSRVR